MEFVKNILYILITAAVPVLTTYLCKFLYTKWTEGKVHIENEKIANTLDNVIQIVLDAVEATNQTFVDELKKKGEFTEESALEAFNTTKEIVLDMLSEDAADVIATVYGDIDVYLDTLIEATVRQLKK
jgi:hypothetical protein